MSQRGGRLTSRIASLAVVFVWIHGGAAGYAQQPVTIPPPPSPQAIAAAASFGPDERVVATHYFYWYRWPDQHFFDDANRRDDALRQHFPDHRNVSYASKDWQRRQMEDLLAAGIDVALLIYWGAPNQYDKPDLRFSVDGIPPLVAALDELAARGRTPRIGMFYDTSTLLGEHAFREPGRGNVDLCTAEGRDIFYRTIRDFFRLLPPRHWACLDGRPIVQLYEAAFAAGHDRQTIEYVYERFAKDFAGRRPFIIAGPSWSFRADARTGWGAALGGPILGDGFAQIGPGYDDSPVSGRDTPTRDRLAGGFYRASWLLALRVRPRMVIVETWNELHEGTGICETLEDGRFYIDLTRRYSELLKAGREPSGDDWAAAVAGLLNAPASNRAGRQFASRLSLEFSVTANGSSSGRLVEQGLRLIPGVADGMFQPARVGGSTCVATSPGVSEHRYLYFDVADPYYYDHRGTLTLRFEYFDSPGEPVVVQYDSTDETSAVADRYKEHPQPITRTGSNEWKTVTRRLPGARCANRQNGGADFRLLSIGGELAIRRVEVSKLPDGYAD